MKELHKSSDGQFTLVVLREGDDYTVGLDGYSWHTHGDVLSAEYELAGCPGLEPESAVRKFVADVIEDRILIAVESEGAEVLDVWITSDPAKNLKYKPEGREIEFRYWSGQSWSGGQ